jgi:hypothetical protein
MTIDVTILADVKSSTVNIKTKGGTDWLSGLGLNRGVFDC